MIVINVLNKKLTDLAFFSFSTLFKYQMTIIIKISIATPVIDPPIALKTGLPTKPEIKKYWKLLPDFHIAPFCSFLLLFLFLYNE